MSQLEVLRATPPSFERQLARLILDRDLGVRIPHLTRNHIRIRCRIVRKLEVQDHVAVKDSGTIILLLSISSLNVVY